MKYFLVKLGQAFNFARKWTPSKLFSNKIYYYIQKTFDMIPPGERSQKKNKDLERVD